VADSKRSLAGNEALFRKVNEAIESGKTPAEARTSIAFRCECAQLGCNDLIELTIAEYEQVRRHARRFLVAVGHENPELETVIDVHRGYEVVEKRDEGGRLAERTDPRS
jgi:hypothetical protein